MSGRAVAVGKSHRTKPVHQRASRRRLALLPAVLLAACRSAAPAPEPAAATPQATPDYVASLPPGESRAVVNQLSNQVVTATTAACRDRSDGDWVACASLRMLKAFDRYGFLASHCREQPSFAALLTCVKFGRSGVDWVLAVGGNPDTDFDWTRPEQAHDRSLKALNDILTERCAGKPEQPGDSCFTALSAKLLGLGDAVATRCAARQTLEQRGACIVDAHDAAMYLSALTVLSR